MADTVLNILIRTVDESSQSIKKIDKEMQTLDKTIASTIGQYATMAGGILVAVKAIDAISYAIDEYSKKQSDLRSLQTLIENQGYSWENAQVSVDNFTSSIEKNTMFTDRQVIQSMQKLISMGMNYYKAQEIMTSITDLATAKNMDLETATNLVGKAYNGNTDALNKYGIKAKDFNDLMYQINTKFSGSAVKQMETYQGQLKILQETWGDFVEMQGEGFSNIFGMALKPLNDYIKAMQQQSPVKMLETAEAKMKSIEELAKKTGTSMESVKQSIAFIGMDKTLSDLVAKAEKLKPIFSSDQLKKEIKEGEDALKKFSDFNDKERNYQLDEAIKDNERKIKEKEKLDEFMVKSEQLKWQSISDIAGAASGAMTALGVASNSAILKSIGVVLSGVQTVINGIGQMLTGGPIGFILGLLGIVTGVANTAAYFRQLEDLQNQNTAQLAEEQARKDALARNEQYNNSYDAYVANRKKGETRDQYEERYNAENGIVSGSRSSGSSSSAPSSVASSSEPKIIYVSNTYNLNAGAVLGDEFSIDNAFKKLMERYDQQKLLTQAG